MAEQERLWPIWPPGSGMSAHWSVKKHTPDDERPGIHFFIVSRGGPLERDTEYVRTKYGPIRKFKTRGEAELTVSGLEDAIARATPKE